MTVDEVRAERDRIRDDYGPGTTGLEELNELASRVLAEISTMPAEYPGDAIIMRALARAAIGADDETS